MIAFLLYFLPPLETWSAWEIIDRIPYLLGFVSIAILVYFGSLLGFGFRPRQLHH